jgi:pectate lyase
MNKNHRSQILCWLLLIFLVVAACIPTFSVQPAPIANQTQDTSPKQTSQSLPQQATPPNNPTLASIRAFPGAEGFGAAASGGRGGVVIPVTTLDPDPNGLLPGSLNWALRQSGPRTITFRVSGLIDAYANIVHGDVTIAGQTSPGGIIVRGLVCDGHYEQNQCDNLIIRHIRSRPAHQLPGAINALDDALRMDGLKTFIIDHGSFENASDEAIQIRWASHGTIQYSILGETVGDHFDRGGMLLNYSASHHPQDNLNIHHNLWYRIGGRMPEITCESSAYPGQPDAVDDCIAHPLHLELSSNLMYDSGFQIWYNRFVDQNQDLGPYRIQLNAVSNQMIVRPNFPYGLFSSDLIAENQNNLYIHDNHLSLYPNYQDGQLAYCCNDFPQNAPNTDPGAAQQAPQRLPFPNITITPAVDLLKSAQETIGAFPRDLLDRRYMAALASQTFDPTPLNLPGANDAFALDFNPATPPPAPIDTDNDGMPDDFEHANGLNPNAADQNATSLSVRFTGISGYTNLECYLNWLADSLVTSQPLPTISSYIYLPAIQR